MATKEHEAAVAVQLAPSEVLPPPVAAAWLMTGEGRDSLIRSLISSQALEGIDVPYDEAAQILDQVLSEPLPDIR